MTNIPKDTKYFKYDNTNPKNRKTGDCVIRSISSLLDKTWDSVLDDLVDISHESKYFITERRVYSTYLEKYNYHICNMPKKQDGKKYTGIEFCEYLNRLYHSKEVKPNILAHIGSHHVTVFKFDAISSSYKCFDSWNPTEYCVGNYWITD